MLKPCEENFRESWSLVTSIENVLSKESSTVFSGENSAHRTWEEKCPTMVSYSISGKSIIKMIHGHMPLCMCPNPWNVQGHMNSNVHCRLVMPKRQGRFLNSSKHSTLAGDADSGGGCACAGAGGIWEISLPSARFHHELKKYSKK